MTDGFTDFERQAMKDRAQELKARKGKTPKDREPELLAKAEEYTPTDRAFALAVHALVKENFPQLAPRTWYGMPAYEKDGKVVFFVQPATKFETRYHSIGFSDVAALDDGPMWPTSYAVTELTEDVAARIVELLRRAVA